MCYQINSEGTNLKEEGSDNSIRLVKRVCARLIGGQHHTISFQKMKAVGSFCVMSYTQGLLKQRGQYMHEQMYVTIKYSNGYEP